MPRGRYRRSWSDDAQCDRGARQAARHSAGLAHLTLLANIYMRRFVLGWKMFGLERNPRLTARDLRRRPRDPGVEGARPKRPCNDCGRSRRGKLKLTVSEEKTRISCKALEGEFDFLGHTFGRMYSARTDQVGIGYRPSKKCYPARGRESPRADRAIMHMARDHNAGGQAELHAARMGELLRGRNRQQGVFPSARCLRGDAVAPVVALQAQSQAAKGWSYPLSHLYGHFPLVRLTPAWARRAVDEGVRSCPRAG